MSPKRAPDIPDLLDQAFEGNGNAVIYARYSSAAQQEQSIDGQLRYCYQYAASRGFVLSVSILIGRCPVPRQKPGQNSSE